MTATLPHTEARHATATAARSTEPVRRCAEPGGLLVRHVPLAKRALASVAAEGRRLARFLGSEGNVRLEPVSR